MAECREEVPCHRKAARFPDEEHGAEGEDVGASVDVAPREGLLGRHVAERADDHVRAGQGLRRRASSRNAEIEQHRAVGSATGEHDVLGLHVAVNHVRSVERAERARDTRRDNERASHRPCSSVPCAT